MNQPLFKSLILASRPKTLFASAGPVLLGLALAYRLDEKFNALTAIITMLCAVLLQVSTNLVNDYYDGVRGIDDENRLGPKRMTSTGELKSSMVKNAFIATFAISFLLGIVLMATAGLPIIVIGILSIIFAYAYTGGPLPLSYYAMGEVLALIFFGPVAVWGTYYIQVLDLNSHNDIVILAGLAPGFISAAIMAINNLRDRETDIKTRKKTLAILAGPQGARALPIVFVLLATFVPIIHVSAFKEDGRVMIATFMSYFFFKTWNAIAREPISANFNIHLANTGKFLFIFCFTYAVMLASLAL
jgi:1,4-dihydroxy-2-naphthoate octaprenyltransferase